MKITNVSSSPCRFHLDGNTYVLKPNEFISVSDHLLPEAKKLVERVDVIDPNLKLDILKLDMEDDDTIQSSFYSSAHQGVFNVGFEDASKSNLLIDDNNRKLTLEALEEYRVFTDSTLVTINENLESIWPDTTGQYYFYIDKNGQLLFENSFLPELITKYAFVSIVYWDAENQKHIYFANEKHGLNMANDTHIYLHLTRGAAFEKGLKIDGIISDNTGDLDEHTYFNVQSGIIHDEDLTIIIPQQNEFPVMYRVGENDWKRKEADIIPLIYNNTENYTGERIAYNSFDGTNWSLSEVDNNSFTLIHVFATNDIEYPILCVLGMDQYNSKSEARENSISEIRTLNNLPVAEFVAIGSIVYETGSNYLNTPKAKIVSISITEDYLDHRFDAVRPGVLAE